jgi:hypothetical protein
MRRKNVTIKELYKLAKATNHENATIRVEYDCNDDWYGINKTVDLSEVRFEQGEFIFHFED